MYVPQHISFMRPSAFSASSASPILYSFVVGEMHLLDARELEEDFIAHVVRLQVEGHKTRHFFVLSERFLVQMDVELALVK